MNKIKQAANSTKKFVAEHKAAVAITAIVVLHVAVVHKHNEFLKEHGLFDEFYKLDEQ